MRLLSVRAYSLHPTLHVHMISDIIKNQLVASFTVGLALLTATPLFAQGRNNPAQSREAIANNWQFDYQQARQVAAETKKPMMVVLRCVP